jgi:D-amino-acid dehydrogenase
MNKDAIVLGAGIVGVSVALHLQARGVHVTLVDRRGPGEETSFGNAGLIERSSVVPHAFPRKLGTLLRYARNRSTDLYWDYKALPSFAAWLARFWWESSPERLDAAPWLGRRPCTPDMRPVIGAAPRHRGLWFAFGHNHHGLTLGPVTGRLLAEMMTGATPFADPQPYRVSRFA